jgi:HK97 gp10 family phage protein
MDEIRIQGLDELQRELESLAPKLAKRTVRRSLRAGANVIKAAIVQLAPKRSGFLSEHVDVRTRLKRDDLAGTAFVGPNNRETYPDEPAKIRKRDKEKRPRTAALVTRFLEFGTRKMAKRPFLTQAADASERAAVDAVVERLKDDLDALI